MEDSGVCLVRGSLYTYGKPAEINLMQNGFTLGLRFSRARWQPRT